MKTAIDRSKLSEDNWHVVNELYKSCCYDRRSPVLRDKLWDDTIDAFISAIKNYNGWGHFPGWLYFCCKKRWNRQSKYQRWDFEHNKINYLFSSEEFFQTNCLLKDDKQNDCQIYENKEFLKEKLKLIKNKTEKKIFLLWLNGEQKIAIGKKFKKNHEIIARIIKKCINKIKKSEGIQV